VGTDAALRARKAGNRRGGVEPVGKPYLQGVYAGQRLSFGIYREAHLEESASPIPPCGRNPTVRDDTGACRDVSHGGTTNPRRTYRKSTRFGNSPPKATRYRNSILSGGPVGEPRALLEDFELPTRIYLALGKTNAPDILRISSLPETATSSIQERNRQTLWSSPFLSEHPAWSPRPKRERHVVGNSFSWWSRP